jgi:DNA primase
VSRSQIEEIKNKLDILEVARSYITNFKKSGPNNFALCPFHHEKTPSFSVNPDMGIFKCFGCGESGDVITFIQKMEGVEFPKALEIAARKAGVKLEKNFSAQDEKLYKERQEILKLNALVSEYYNYILLKHKQGKQGREYIKGRKITKSLVEKFKIGYAPRSYTNLIKFLQSKGYKVSDLIKWGLVVAANGRTYDKFRSRIIFPLIDHHDDVVGFSGRTILKNTKAPKYLHSPQTLAFNKSKFLFGLNLAKSEGRKKDFLIFCEGQLDAVSSYKTKVNNVVASLGTALAADQLELAKRYTKNIYFCFDNDLAGETALIRSANLAHIIGLNVKAVNIPQGKDADELINTKKSDWEDSVKKAEPIVDHMLRRLYKRLDLSKLKDKEEFSKIILPIIASIPQRIEQSHYLHRLALILNIDENILAEELDTLKKTIKEGRSIPQVNTQNIKKILESPVNIKEEYLLALIFQHTHFLNVSIKQCSAKYFSSPLARQIFTKLGKYTKDKKRFSIKNFVSGLEEHEVTFVQNLLLKNLDDYFELETEYEKEIEGIIKFLKKNYLRNKVKGIKARIEQAEISENKIEVKKLLKKLVEVTDELGKV